MVISWLVAVAIAYQLAKRLTVEPSTIVGVIARNLAALSCSVIGTVIGSILFKGSVLTLGSVMVSVIITGVLIMLIRGKIADL
jgi:hypothetical protein